MAMVSKLHNYGKSHNVAWSRAPPGVRRLHAVAHSCHLAFSRTSAIWKTTPLIRLTSAVSVPSTYKVDEARSTVPRCAEWDVGVGGGWGAVCEIG